MSMECYANFEAALKGCGEYVTQVRGVSMYPMLRYRKDPVLIHPVCGDLKRYDVAVYWRDDNYVVHRVLEVKKDHYVIRGDNCVAKEYVPKELVRGVVVGFWRCGQYVDCRNTLYNIYARVWVALNPMLRIWRKFKHWGARMKNN